MTQEGKQTLKYSAIGVLTSMIGASIPVLVLAFRLGVWSDRSEVNEARLSKAEQQIERNTAVATGHELRISALEQWRSWEKELKVKSNNGGQ